jgi:hypothetical protein
VGGSAVPDRFSMKVQHKDEEGGERTVRAIRPGEVTFDPTCEVPRDPGTPSASQVARTLTA